MQHVLLLGNQGAAAPLAPADITGLQLWLDASDATTLFQDSAGTTPVAANNDVVGLWRDKSGNSRHYSRTTTANKPLYKTAVQNGLSALSFDGSNDSLSLGSGLNILRNVGGATIAIARGTAVASSRVAFHISTGSGLNNARLAVWANASFQAGLYASRTDAQVSEFVNSTITGAVVQIAKVDYTTRAAQNRINGSINGTSATLQNAGSTSDTNSAGSRVGAQSDGNFFWSGNLFEILVWPRALTNDEGLAITAYLNTKWSVYA